MARKAKTRGRRRRNPLVPALRKLGQGVKPSGRVYRRRPKHPGRREADS